MRNNFNCARCGACCQWAGAVRLAAGDAARLAGILELEEEAFVEIHTKLSDDRHCLELVDCPDGSCRFLDTGLRRCAVYAARPTQCRNFPGQWNFPGWEARCPGGAAAKDADAVVMGAAGKFPKSSAPLFLEGVSAGFPSPAAGYVEAQLDLNRRLVKNPPSTFFVRVQGDSMTGAGIADGDILVVDRSLEPRNKAVVVAILDGEFLVKRLSTPSNGLVELLPANPKYRPIRIVEGMDFQVWGVVTALVREFGGQ